MKQLIKNIPHEEKVMLKGLVTIQEGQVVSKTLTQNDAISITLFAFAKGEEIGSHDSKGDALVTVLEGVGRFSVDGTNYILKEGESLVMPANKPHAVYAEEDFIMQLIVVF